MRQRILATIILLGLTVAVPTHAHAAPITIEFQFSNFISLTGGFPDVPDATASGFVTFDSGLIPPPGGIVCNCDTQNGLPTLALSISFSYLDQHYDLSNARLWGVSSVFGQFSPALGGMAMSPGCEIAFGCMTPGFSDFDIVSNGDGTTSMSIGIADVPGIARGTGTWQVVPIPAAAWLLASALGALGWASRRTRAETSR